MKTLILTFNEEKLLNEILVKVISDYLKSEAISTEQYKNFYRNLISDVQKLQEKISR